MRNVDDEYLLSDGNTTSKWKLFKLKHRLSEKAKADRRSLDDGDEVPIWWAAPLGRLTGPSRFWAFFPTNTASLVAGILNAPWKTNEDRQNLLPGPYNDELIESAAEMIAAELPKLATQTDPAPLDTWMRLPRRHERDDSEQVDLLREQLFSHLCRRGIVPDQDGNLRAAEEIRYPPKELTPDGQIDLAPFERWAAWSKPSIGLASPQGAHAQPACRRRPIVFSATACSKDRCPQGHDRRVAGGARGRPGAGPRCSSFHGRNSGVCGDTARNKIKVRLRRYHSDGK